MTREEPRSNMPAVQASSQQPDDKGTKYASSDAQFVDLHAKLQNMAQSVDNVIREVQQLASKSEGRHQEVMRNAMSADKLNAMDQRIISMESTIRNYQAQFTNLQSLLKDSHVSLNEGLTQQMTHCT